MKKPKWIVQGEEFIIGRAELHMDLIDKEINEPCHGGGLWKLNPDNKILYLYSKSHDYGVPTKEQIMRSLKSLDKTYEGYTILWSSDVHLLEDEDDYTDVVWSYIIRT